MRAQSEGVRATDNQSQKGASVCLGELGGVMERGWGASQGNLKRLYMYSFVLFSRLISAQGERVRESEEKGNMRTKTRGDDKEEQEGACVRAPSCVTFQNRNTSLAQVPSMRFTEGLFAASLHSCRRMISEKLPLAIPIISYLWATTNPAPFIPKPHLATPRK